MAKNNTEIRGGGFVSNILWTIVGASYIKAYMKYCVCELSPMWMMGRMHFEERVANFICCHCGKL